MLKGNAQRILRRHAYNRHNHCQQVAKSDSISHQEYHTRVHFLMWENPEEVLHGQPMQRQGKLKTKRPASLSGLVVDSPSFIRESSR